uniref:Uncharacterized protein n=1 Tax=Anguilla anguilla TaxID=7936 RepID=A0A0E9UQU8_ANGAN
MGRHFKKTFLPHCDGSVYETSISGSAWATH